MSLRRSIRERLETEWRRPLEEVGALLDGNRERVDLERALPRRVRVRLAGREHEVADPAAHQLVDEDGRGRSVWDTFCDWYLELIKPVIQGEGGVQATGAGADETRAVAGWVLDQILVMLHPFMPFITEELWSKMGAREHELIVAHWPMADARALDPEAAKEIDWLIRLVSEVRNAEDLAGIPEVKAASWKLMVGGDAVGKETAFTLAQL